MAERKWYYLQENEQVGPVSREDLLRLLQEGTLAPDVYVWSEGLAQWQPASAIPELGGQGGVEGLPVPKRVRPTSVTVFGILNIVFGSLGLLCTPLAVFALWIPQQPGAPQIGPAMMAYTIIGYIVGFFCAILLLAAGIGLLYQKRWARRCSYGYGWFAIVWGIIGIIVTAAMMASGMQGSGGPEETAAQVGGIVGGMCGGILGLIYPIFLVVFMKRQNVVEACQQ
jgi:hypothetical protein